MIHMQSKSRFLLKCKCICSNACSHSTFTGNSFAQCIWNNSRGCRDLLILINMSQVIVLDNSFFATTIYKRQ